MFVRRVMQLAFVCSLSGCSAMRTSAVSSAYRAPVPPRGIVLVLDGAGGNPDASNAIWTIVHNTDEPLIVESFDWTHGRNLALADMTDQDHSRAMSQKFAGVVRRYQATHPGVPIVVVGYSAGSFVALESTRYLERDSLERMVLLAPAVAANYDLRQALVTSRRGIDAFSSERDRFILGVGTDVVGTADGQTGIPTAGRVGFYEPPPGFAQRLHPHPWDVSMTWTGNSGNHVGALNPRFLRAYVLPLLDPGDGGRARR